MTCTNLSPATARISCIEEQELAIDSLIEGIRWSKPVQTLGDYAGTGKTTAIRPLQERLPNFAVVVFTGRPPASCGASGLAEVDPRLATPPTDPPFLRFLAYDADADLVVMACPMSLKAEGIRLGLEAAIARRRAAGVSEDSGAAPG
jgi:hypothetical protein